jgi:hypothetical protein
MHHDVCMEALEPLVGPTSRAENVLHAGNERLHCIGRPRVAQLGKRPEHLCHVTCTKVICSPQHFRPCRLQQPRRLCLKLCKRPQDVAHTLHSSFSILACVGIASRHPKHAILLLAACIAKSIPQWQDS